MLKKTLNSLTRRLLPGGLYLRERLSWLNDGCESARSADVTGANGTDAPNSDHDVIGYITGWRMWSLRQLFDEGLSLQSPVMGLCWRPRRPMKGWPAHPPQGIYALTQREDPEPIRRQWLGAREALLGGDVALWGDVYEHQQGWRAQYAYPLSLTWLSSYCGDCGKIVPAKFLRPGQNGGFIRQGSRGEFVVLCQRCGQARMSRGRRFEPDDDERLADTESVLMALRRAYLPYLADACEVTDYLPALRA